MASPAVVTAATSGGSSASDTTPDISLPGSITSGNTLIAWFRSAAGGAIGWPVGWTEIYDDAPTIEDDQISIAWRKADGTEVSTIALTSGAGRWAAIVWEISGASDPTVRAPEISTVAVDVSINVDPTTVTPTGGSKDYLFLFLGSMSGKGTIVTAPTNYSGQLYAASTGGGGNTVHCRAFGFNRQLTASSEDPGLTEISTSSQGWSAFCLAVHPPDAEVTRRIILVTG